MSTQPVQQRTILLGRALGRHIDIDNLYRHAVVDKFSYDVSALWMVHEITNVEVRITTHQDGHPSRRGGNFCKSVPIQTVKNKARGQHPCFLQKNHCRVFSPLK